MSNQTSFIDFLGSTAERDVDAIQLKMEAFFSYISGVNTPLSKTVPNMANELKGTGDKSAYIDNELASNNLVDEFDRFINSRERTFENVETSVLKTLRTNNVLKDFADQDVFKNVDITMGGKPIVTKDQASVAHREILDQVSKDPNPGVQKIVGDETLSQPKKYDQLQGVDADKKTNTLTNIGKKLHFNFSYKRFFNIDNFPLLISCVVIFVIGYYVNIELYNMANPAFPMLSPYNLTYAFLGVLGASILTAYYFKFDIITCLIFII